MAHAAFVLPGEGASRYRASQQMGPSATPPRSHRHPDLLSSRLEDDPTYFRDLHEDWAAGSSTCFTRRWCRLTAARWIDGVHRAAFRHARLPRGSKRECKRRRE
jgi:hypothetical protein